jgi:hypothetical protein
MNWRFPILVVLILTAYSVGSAMGMVLADYLWRM